MSLPVMSPPVATRPVVTRPAPAAGPSAARPAASARPAPAARPACAGLDPRVIFARRVKDAAPALRACARCTLHRACEAAVAPAETWFDGVCAGRLWRNGRPVAALDRDGLPGTGTRPGTRPAVHAQPQSAPRERRP